MGGVTGGLPYLGPSYPRGEVGKRARTLGEAGRSQSIQHIRRYSTSVLWEAFTAGGDVGVVAYPATTRILGPWAFRARECRYSHPGPGRAAHSRALARIWDCMRIYGPRTPYSCV